MDKKRIFGIFYGNKQLTCKQASYIKIKAIVGLVTTYKGILHMCKQQENDIE